MIEAIQRTGHYAKEWMVDISEKCSFTAAHPVLKNGIWYRADELLPPTYRFVVHLYNYEIQGHYVLIGGEHIATPLGVSIERLEMNNPISQHYWNITLPRLLQFNHIMFSIASSSNDDDDNACDHQF